MTRLRSVADSAGNLDCPLVVMDTAPAAVLGATFDPVAAARVRGGNGDDGPKTAREGDLMLRRMYNEIMGAKKEEELVNIR